MSIAVLAVSPINWRREIRFARTSSINVCVSLILFSFSNTERRNTSRSCWSEIVFNFCLLLRVKRVILKFAESEQYYQKSEMKLTYKYIFFILLLNFFIIN